MLYPEVAGRDCQSCIEFLYDEETGAIKRQRGSGKPIRRAKHGAPPCRQRGKSCPKGTPDNQLDLTEQNRRAYAHFLQCQAVNEFPNDSRVRRNARLIAVGLDRARRALDMRRDYMTGKRLDHIAKLLAIRGGVGL